MSDGRCINLLLYFYRLIVTPPLALAFLVSSHLSPDLIDFAWLFIHAQGIQFGNVDPLVPPCTVHSAPLPTLYPASVADHLPGTETIPPPPPVPCTSG